MSGSAYDALKEGAKILGQGVFEGKEFEHFVTLFYESNAHPMVAQTYEEYERNIMASHAGGGTNFGQCFDWIEKFLVQNPGVKDISVIFFTDGQDGGGQFTTDTMLKLSNLVN